MSQVSSSKIKRTPKNPPLVPLSYLRKALGFSLEGVGTGVAAVLGREYGKGSISAIETGQRGASPEILEALEQLFDLPVGTIRTDYTPRAPRRKAGS